MQVRDRSLSLHVWPHAGGKKKKKKILRKKGETVILSGKGLEGQTEEVD